MEIPNELMCPISLGLLAEPITSPCCGRVLSKSSALMIQQPKCPLCNSSWAGLDISTIPTNKNIQYIIDEWVQAHPEQIAPSDGAAGAGAGPELSIYSTKYINKNIGLLKIAGSDIKTLMILAVDKSGSMSGQPINQVKMSLKRATDLTFQNPNLITWMIPYDSAADSIRIDTLNTKQTYYNIIDHLSDNMGGTSFRSAFEKIIEISAMYSADLTVSSIQVIFLTDGQDMDSNRIGSVGYLKTSVEKAWTRDYSIHSIGFSSAHDYEFLNKLRLSGKTEGAYRYADPREDNDILSGKINSVLDVIANSGGIQVKQIIRPGDVIKQIESSMFFDLGNSVGTVELSLQITDKVITQPVLIITVPAQSEEVRTQWIDYLIDMLAGKLSSLSTPAQAPAAAAAAASPEPSIEQELLSELILRKAKSIKTQTVSPVHIERLDSIIKIVGDIRRGMKLDEKTLNDMKFEGRFATKINSDATKHGAALQDSRYSPGQLTAYGSRKVESFWSPISLRQKRCVSNKTAPELAQLIARGKTPNVVQWISSNPVDPLVLDSNKSDYLMGAASIGRVRIVRALLAHNFDMTRTNDAGFNALDLAIYNGRPHTAQELFNAGFRPRIDTSKLLMACIDKSYYNTAEFLLTNNLVIITEQITSSCSNPEGYQWLCDRSAQAISPADAINKGLVGFVEKAISSGTMVPIKLSDFHQVLIACTDNHIQIFKALDKAGLIEDLHGSYKIIDPVDQAEEITWLFYIACDKGNKKLFEWALDSILNLPDANSGLEIINRRNLKGVTPLWAAVSNKRTDIVIGLLENGADPNIPDNTGNGPLIPAIQKGLVQIAELLLAAGTKLTVYNPARDNPVLGCCRTGQYQILDMLLKTYDRASAPEYDRASAPEYDAAGLEKIFNTFADIDGFNPMLAATELDKYECIKVLKSYGADIETRTDPANKILGYATPLILAAFYNRLGAAKTLCELGADQLAVNIDGMGPLHIAIKQSSLEVVGYLLSLPSATEALKMRDCFGRLPKYYATINGNERIFKEYFTDNLALLFERVIGEDIGQERINEIKRLIDTNELLCENLGDLELTQSDSLATRMILQAHPLAQSIIRTSNLDKLDDYGISPMFWLKLLDPTRKLIGWAGSIDNLEVNQDIVTQQLKRISAIADKSLQNRMLLSNQNLQLVKLDRTGMDLLISESDIRTKMDQGLGLVIDPKVLADIAGTRREYSLLGFIDKVRTLKVPNGKAGLVSHIVSRAKINAIKLVATGEELLNPSELICLYLYTSSIIFCKQVNEVLLNWYSESSELFKPFVHTLYKTIGKLPMLPASPDTEVYRCVDYPFDPEIYKIGSVICWKTFSFASGEYAGCSELIGNKRGMVFIIKSNQARSIAKYSANPADNEVIFLPDSKFVVKAYYVASPIALAQANIRSTTFRMDELRMGPILKGKASIIIELGEVDTCKQSSADLEQKIELV